MLNNGSSYEGLRDAKGARNEPVSSAILQRSEARSSRAVVDRCTTA